jgi:uncharacterized protein (DUF58 family)
VDGKALLQEIRRCPVEFVPGKNVVSPYPGEWTSPFEGKGYEPRGFRDFEMGDNPHRIHLPTSARRGSPTIVERVALRDFKLMVVVDASPSMRVREKSTIQTDAAALLLYSAWQAETTFALALRSNGGVRSFGLGIGSRHFYHLYRILWGIFHEGEGLQTVGTRIHLSRCLPPNAMLLYCSDFLDPDGSIAGLKMLTRAVRRYDFVPVVVQDELEYDFPQTEYGSFVPFANPETGARQDVWISPRTAKHIADVHTARFDEMTQVFNSRGIRPLHLDVPGVGNIRPAISAYFGQRKRRKSA